MPGAVVVSVALNGQQFINDVVYHRWDEENTFIYYQDPFISDYFPKAGPTYGNTKIDLSGMGFTPFKYENNTVKVEPIYVKFTNVETGEPIG